MNDVKNTSNNQLPFCIQQQVIDDMTSGLVLTFETLKKTEKSPLEYRLRIEGGCIPFGNREIYFSESGIKVGAGTYLT